MLRESIIHNSTNNMKYKTLIFISLLLSSHVFADDHSTTSLDQVNFAIKQAESGHASNASRYLAIALNKTLEELLAATGKKRSHLNDAVTELQQAIDHGNLGHPGEIASHARTAAWHIKSAN